MAFTPAQEGIILQMIDAFEAGMQIPELPALPESASPWDLRQEVVTPDGISRKAYLAQMIKVYTDEQLQKKPTLGEDGKIPDSYLHDSVHDVVYLTSIDDLPAEGNPEKLYIVEGKGVYQWTGEEYKPIAGASDLFEVDENGDIRPKDATKGFYTNSFLSARGVDPFASNIGAAFDEDAMWDILSDGTGEHVVANKFLVGQGAMTLLGINVALGGTLTVEQAKNALGIGTSVLTKEQADGLYLSKTDERIEMWTAVANMFEYDDDGNIRPKDSAKGFYTRSFLSSRGVDPSASNIGSAFDDAVMWQLLAAATNEQINITHLTDALASYAKTEALANYLLKSDAANLYQPKGNYAPLVNNLIPSQYLPSYVDDVIEASSVSSFPSTGESGKIYVDTSTNKTYRWSGSQYVEISSSLALGEVTGTAYDGGKGKANADAIATIKSWFDASGNAKNALKLGDVVASDYALKSYVTSAIAALDSSITAETNKAITAVTIEGGKITGHSKARIPSSTEFTNWNNLVSWIGLDTAADAVYIKENRGFYSNGFISARGVDVDAGAGGGIFDDTIMWQLLGAATNEQINTSHLTTALTPYARTTALQSLVEATSYIKGFSDTNASNIHALEVALADMEDEINELIIEGTGLSQFFTDGKANDALKLGGEPAANYALKAETEILKSATRSMVEAISRIKGYSDTNASDIFTLEVALADAIDNLDVDIATLNGYFTDGKAKDALKLGGVLAADYALKTSVRSIGEAVAYTKGFIETNASDIHTLEVALADAIDNLDVDIATLNGYFTDGSAKSAIKLLNARKLWGQTFDGTADISGDLTGVGNITASGIITAVGISVTDLNASGIITAPKFVGDLQGTADNAKALGNYQATAFLLRSGEWSMLGDLKPTSDISLDLGSIDRRWNNVYCRYVDAGNGALELYSGSAATMVLTSGNRVGIGISSPSYKLDVNGTGHYSSWLYVEDTIEADGQISSYTGISTTGYVSCRGVDVLAASIE